MYTSLRTQAEPYMMYGPPGNMMTSPMNSPGMYPPKADQYYYYHSSNLIIRTHLSIYLYLYLSLFLATYIYIYTHR